jgi:hypothetical protein
MGVVVSVEQQQPLRMCFQEQLPVPELRADCASCFGLCCVVPAFSKSADFAIDKPAGKACPNLQVDFRCGIHSTLRQAGFSGCTVYDCFGAGQKVSRSATSADQMFEAFPVVRQLHELLWYLAESLTMPAAQPLYAELGDAYDETQRLSNGTPQALGELDVAAHRQAVNALLVRVSVLARGDTSDPKKNRRGQDLIGAKLSGADLSGANLRAAQAIGADLRRADLRGADVLGTDFRAADLRGADLTGSIFLTQSQLDAANGDGATKLPPALTRPAHWTSPAG